MSLFRDKSLVQDQMKTIENCLRKNNQKIFKIRTFCLNICRKDYEFRSYDYQSKMVISMNEKNPDKLELYIEHNNMPDLLITAIPEITFISFVCNFGGLIGMWLGISILVIFKDVCNVIRLLISKGKVFNFNTLINLRIIQIRRSVNKVCVNKINVHANIQERQANDPIFLKYN